MIIDIVKLKSGISKYVDFEFVYNPTQKELENTGILELNDCYIDGIITEQFSSYNIELNIKGDMILPCSISLKPIKHSFNINLNENLEEISDDLSKNIENTIDIFEIVWENILMEIPSKVISEDLTGVITCGEGWKLITEENNPK